MKPTQNGVNAENEIYACEVQLGSKRLLLQKKRMFDLAMPRIGLTTIRVTVGNMLSSNKITLIYMFLYM